MTEQYQKHLEDLSQSLVTPERFGGVALTLALLPGEAVQPEDLAEVIDFPYQHQLEFHQLELFRGEGTMHDAQLSHHRRMVTSLTAYRDQRRAAELKPPA